MKLRGEMDPALQDNDDTVALRSQIAALEAAGNHAEAIPLAERYAATIRLRHGEDHPAYADALTTLAVLMLHKANRLVEAEALLRRALDIYEKVPGAHPPDLVRTLNSLAQLFNDSGRLAEAELLRRAVLAIEAGQGPLLAPPPSGGAGRDDRDAPPLDGMAAEAGVPHEADERRERAPPAAAARARAEGFAAGRSQRRAAGEQAKEDMEPGAEPRSTVPAMPAQAPEPAARLPAAKPKPDEVSAPGASPAKRPDPAMPQKALEVEAGRLAYQIPRRMWVGLQDTVEVRLGRLEAKGLVEGFGGRGEVRTERMPIVETMSVSLLCEPGTFDIVPRSEKDQLVKPDLVLGTPLHSDDFGRWVWLVTPRQKGEHTLLVKVSAAIRDSRGLPVSAALPDRTFAVSVRVRLLRAAALAIARAAPGLAWAVVTALVGVFTKDYWWPAIRSMIGMG